MYSNNYIILKLSDEYRDNLKQEEELWNRWKTLINQSEHMNYVDEDLSDQVETAYNNYVKKASEVNYIARLTMKYLLEI
ncbi:hypothetical protein [Enterocloster alcoholdehydrogenati]|uniref:Uncharacterized protein n=1 Tax=Enterocloster alcoholdehydrogenati TaxID=2547410 RepID=A0ABQ0B013_9FIRM